MGSRARLEGDPGGALVRVQDLRVLLPDDSVVVDAATLVVYPGRVTAVLGPSGAGKTTLVRAILTPAELRRAGFKITSVVQEIATPPAFVPQRGALLDHLDVSENIALAQAGAGLPQAAAPWLHAVDLDHNIGNPGRSVSTLSGGQAQRVAVARALAAGRRIIVLDEPSVGLDPLGVRTLGRLLLKQARQHQAAIIVVTHDLALAGGAADEILFLDPGRKALIKLDWSGPAEFDEPSLRQRRIAELEATVEDLLLRESLGSSAIVPKRRSTLGLLSPFRVAGMAIAEVFRPHLLSESSVVFKRAVRDSFVRPGLFYMTVGTLLGFTVPYVIANISHDLRPAAIFGLLKGTYILALAPPLSAILFAATSGSAVSAWLGGLRLHGQVTALEGLGIPPARYLWSPAWLALALCYLATFIVFTMAMMLGGWMLYRANEVQNAFSLITADFLAPPPTRYPYLARALWSVGAYTLAAASIVVAKASESKAKSEDVTNAMTSSVIRVTLLVVILELLTVLVVRGWEGSHG